MWLAERTFLRRSLETSVEVDSEESLEGIEELLNRMRELVDLAEGKSEVALLLCKTLNLFPALGSEFVECTVRVPLPS